MLKKIFLFTMASTFSFNATAGLFDSNDFKCGREDSIKALSDYIKESASGSLQSNFIARGKNSYNKPLSVYQSTLNNLGVVITNVSTLSSSGSNNLSCGATISIKLPQDIIDVVSDVPEKMSSITYNNGRMNSSGVVWNDVRYSIKLADNKKDILISDLSRNEVSASLYNAAIMVTDKDEIINKNSLSKLSSAQYQYSESDRKLNYVWKELPDSARNAMKKTQVAWVQDKVAKCGKLSDTTLDTVSSEQKMSIYQCQTKMTNERISYLSGNSN